MSSENSGCAPQLIENAQQALGRLHQNQLFADWRIYGDALVMLQAEAMHLAKTNQPKGRRYCSEIGSLLKEHRLDTVSKSTRSRLVEVMKNRPAIEEWLATLPPEKRLKLNHPEPVLSAWKRATVEPKEKAEPKPELVGIWKSATAEDRGAALDAGGLELLLEALSPFLRAEIEQQLANPHAGKRLAEKDAKERQTVEAAKKETVKRAPKLGNVTAYNESKKAKRTKAKMAKPKDVGQWRKFPREKLQAVYDQVRQRMETEHLNVRELKRLEGMRERLAALEKTETAIARQGSGGDPTETAKARMAENAKRAEEPQAVAA